MLITVLMIQHRKLPKCDRSFTICHHHQGAIAYSGNFNPDSIVPGTKRERKSTFSVETS
ncbi:MULTISPECIES: hypothetical protein [unclassified Coleofasciculus]|uniref:hypothetical protein n=1 Tax=unclassified Coleofasciculus TaxID=2692782 RepID=UPI00188050A1|nr:MULTISPECIES: hypothetical protein [unclassified Coleofasciculus]MBE9129592.1 hypothetical protein [Coleofasciculus sp. LEGE 07081]MBE9152145.1 hypothetical protein [Coleofasciculus sp. LEGE 07092]